MKKFLAINIRSLVQESETLPDRLAESVFFKLLSLKWLYKDDPMPLIGELAHLAGQLTIAPYAYCHEIRKLKNHFNMFKESLNYMKNLKDMLLKDREWVYSNGQSDTKPYPVSYTLIIKNAGYILSRKIDSGEIHKKMDKMLLDIETLNKKNEPVIEMDVLRNFFVSFKKGIIRYQIQIETIQWLLKTFPKLRYQNIAGLCLVGPKKELAKLTQNEPDYFCVSLDDPFNYELTFKKLKKSLTLCESGI